MKVESMFSSQHPELFGNDKKRKEKRELVGDRFAVQARAGIERIYDKHRRSDDRIAALTKGLVSFFKHVDKDILPDEKINEIQKSLSGCVGIEKKQEFVDSVMAIIQPLIDIRKEKAAAFEEAQSRAMNEEGGFVALNRLVSYGKKNSVIHIHHTFGETVKNKRTLYLDAMRKLARIVHDDPDVRTITATSWIVAKHPDMFERSGFSIDSGFSVSEMSKKMNRIFFSADKREVKRATISREDFLRNFLKE